MPEQPSYKMPYRQYITILAIPTFSLVLYYVLHQYRLYYTLTTKIVIFTLLFAIFIPTTVFVFIKGGNYPHYSFWLIYLQCLVLFFACVYGAMLTMEQKEEIALKYYEANVKNK